MVAQRATTLKKDLSSPDYPLNCPTFYHILSEIYKLYIGKRSYIDCSDRSISVKLPSKPVMLLLLTPIFLNFEFTVACDFLFTIHIPYTQNMNIVKKKKKRLSEHLSIYMKS